MDIITATSDLATLCGDLSTDKFVAVDTEFMRESTFWPELCLIQIAGTKREAQERNVPRSRVLKDDALTEVASQIPVTTETLRELRALPKGYAGSRIGDAILAAVKAGLDVDSVNIPAPADDRNQLTDAASAAAEVLRLVLKIVCETEGIAGKLIAGTSDLEAIAMDDAADVPAMRGWRRQVFGEVALKVKAGELGIVLKKGKARLVPMLKDARDLAAAE